MAEQNGDITAPGKIEIYDDVVKTIAGLAASKVEGICGLKGGLIKGAVQAVTGQKNYGAGVEVGRDSAASFTIDLHVIIDYGAKINEVAGKVQKSVKEQVEELTGRPVGAVNVHVADIRLPEELLKPAGAAS